MHGGSEAPITRLTAVDANATYVPSAEIAGVEASPLATLSGPSDARLTAVVRVGVEPIPHEDLRAGEVARDLPGVPVGRRLRRVGVGGEGDEPAVVGHRGLAQSDVSVRCCSVPSSACLSTGRAWPGWPIGIVRSTTMTPTRSVCAGVELVGVGDHRAGTGDGRREARVDVVGARRGRRRGRRWWRSAPNC